MEFSKAYEYFKKHFRDSHMITVIMLDSQAWITNGSLLLRVENVPEEVQGKRQLWSWKCPEKCDEQFQYRECEHEAECCSQYTDGFCDHKEECEKNTGTCGKGIQTISAWETPDLTWRLPCSESVKRLLESCPTTEIKPGKNKIVGDKRVKPFTPHDTIMDLKYFNLFRGKGLTYYQSESLKEIYVKDSKSQTLGIMMPRRT